MTRKSKVSVPVASALDHTLRLQSSHPDVTRALSKLSRPSLLSLALNWLAPKHLPLCKPFLEDDLDEDDSLDSPYEIATTVDEVREAYTELRGRRGGKKEIVERILEGDWRKGITLYQLAMAEIQHMLDHPNSLKWNALLLSKIKMTEASKASTVGQANNNAHHLPRMHAQTFLLNLQKEVSPLAKAHYHITRVPSMSMTVLRVYIHDSPYATQRSLQSQTATTSSAPDSSKSVFFVFPDGSPYIHASLGTTAPATTPGQAAAVIPQEGRGLRKVILDAIPKALSRPAARYELKTTSLSARSLTAMLHLRGAGRANAAQGGWSIFAEDSFGPRMLDYAATSRKRKSSDGDEPDNVNPQKPPDDAVEDKENSNPASKGKPRKDAIGSVDRQTPESPRKKRRRLVAEGRFGSSACEGDGRGIERFEVRIDDPFPAHVSGASPSTRVADQGKKKGRRSPLDRAADEQGTVEADVSWAPNVRIAFHGAHVFAGIRKLVEAGVVDGEKMPGWMTGEAGVSVGVVRDGRIRTREGIV